MKLVRVLLLLSFLAQLLLPLAANAQGTEQFKKCFNLSAEEAELALGEAVDPIPTVDESNGYCTYASLAENNVPSSDDLFPTYGPKGQHQYLAATVWPVGSASDPWMYLAYAILDRDQTKLSDFTTSFGMTDLEALANAESGRKNVTRQYLPDLAEGALWYWQETSTGHHLAGIYAVSGEQRVAVQALVNPEQSEEDVQNALAATLEKLLAVNPADSSNSSAIPELRIAPVFVDDCPNFSPYDAAAILQEPVNADAPVGNLVFGPLSIEYGEALRGLCGYTNDLPVAANAPSAADPAQTHLATDLPYSHAVATGHMTGEILYSTNGTMQMDWMEMIALADMVAAANPKNDGKVFDYLYGTFNIGDFASWTDALGQLAKGSPSFKVSRLELAAGDPRDELLWLWQTLDDGYFSLLVSRQGDDFDLVAALLGSKVNEKVVLGYSKVLLEKIADPAATSAQSSTLCNRLSEDAASEIVGETVKGTDVQSSQGTGCKYTPSTDRTKTQPADFSPFFQTFGLLAGTVPPKAAQSLISGFVQELSTSGSVRDGEALGALLKSIQAQDFVKALQQFGDLEWNAATWQVENVSELGEGAVLISGKSGNGWTQFYLLKSREPGVDYLTGVLHSEIDDVREEIVAAARLLGQDSTTPARHNSPSANAQVNCTLLSLEQAEKILGDSLRVQSAEGERGSGCKFTPTREDDGKKSADFSPIFVSQGVLAGIMSDEGAGTTLSELMEMTGSKDLRLTRALSRNDIVGALSRLAVLAPITTDEWTVEPLPEVGKSAIWIHGELEGTLLSIFLNGKGKDETQAVLIRRSLEGDVEAMRDVVVGALTP